jgi:hypothetical protein
MNELGDGRTDRRGGLSRRHFLIVSAAFVVPLLARPIRPWAVLTDPTAEVGDSLAGRLADLFRQPDSARIVGLEFLRVTPSERTTGALVAAVASGLPGGIAALDDPIDPEDLRGLLQERIRQDFAEDAIVELRGWIVSRTEARLCGIVAIGRDRAGSEPTGPGPG